jgi:hypothetical protein
LDEPIDFGGIVTLHSLRLDDRARPGGEFSASCLASWTDFSYKYLDELYLFFHFLDADGRQRGATDVRLARALVPPDIGGRFSCPVPDDLEPGHYDLWAGIYSGRTFRRLRPRTAERPTRGDRARVSSMAVHPDP